MKDDYDCIGIRLLDSCNEQSHMHEECEVDMLLYGSGSVNLKDGAERLIPGSVLVVNPFEQHGFWMGENSIAVRISIPYKFLAGEIPVYFNCRPSRVNGENVRQYASLKNVIARAMLAVLDKGRNEITITHYLYFVLYVLCQNFKMVDYAETESWAISQKYLSYIYEHYQESISPSTAAKQFFLSPGYFSRVFKESIGISFTKYLMNVRLENAREDLLTSDDSISMIADKNGFANLKSFHMAFKRQFAMSPSQFQTAQSRKDKANSLKELVASDKVSDLRQLLNKFIEADSPQEKADSRIVAQTATVSLDKKGVPMRQTWRNMLCVGKASDILNPDIMAQISDIRHRMKFLSVNFHGLLDDDMRIYAENSRGEPELNFYFVDKIFDFLTGLGMKPFVELSFMPRQLAADPNEHSVFGGYHSKPVSYRKWNHLVFELIKHCMMRYKYEEVKTWKFQIWDSACYDAWWKSSPEEFYQFYQASYKMIKSTYPELCVGAPSVSIFSIKNTKWLDRFLQFTKDNYCVPDFISLSVYPHDDYKIFKINNRTQQLAANVKKIVSDPLDAPLSKNSNYFRDGKVLVKAKLRAAGLKLPIYVTQWNSSQIFGFSMRDMIFQAAYIVKNICDNFDDFESFGYWILSEEREEYFVRDIPFHGSGALISNLDIKKPSYFAFDFLARLRGKIVTRGDGYFVTREGDNVFVLLHNYVHPCERYCEEHFASQAYEDIFPNSYTKEISLNIEGFAGGIYKIKCHLLNRENGSSYDNWLRLGALVHLEEEDIAYLKAISIPRQTLTVKEIESVYTLGVQLQSNEIRLYEFIRES